MAQVDTFSTTEPTLFIVEGLIYYLEHADVAALFVGINKLSGPGSILCFDFMHSDAISGEKNYSGFDNLKTMCHLKGEDFKSGFDPSVDVIDGFLRKSGFKLDMMMVPREMVAEYLGHLEWNDEENPPICPYYSYVQAVHCPVSTAKAGLISM
jgi:O-methyltransferase involved in polyketide biosynthesis